MKARSLTPAERVRGHPPSTHTLMLLYLTSIRCHLIVTLRFAFVSLFEENFPLGMTNSATINSKLGFSGSFRWFLIRLNIRGNASYEQQPSQPHYACNLCFRSEKSIYYSKKKSLIWTMTVRGLLLKLLWSTTLVVYFKTKLRNIPDVNG